MKKSLLFLFILILPVILVGCGSKIFDLSDYMSEITTSYYQGENENFNASISVGQREINYKVDGKHGPDCDFSLVEVKFSTLKEELGLDIEVIIDGQENDLFLEYVPLHNTFMGDLGFAIKSGSKVTIKIGDETLNLSQVSENFTVDYNKALDIAKLQLIDEISSYNINGQFNAEGYLKLLNKEGESFNQLFWCFTLVGSDGLKFDVVIDANTGEVIGANI